MNYQFHRVTFTKSLLAIVVLLLSCNNPIIAQERSWNERRFDWVNQPWVDDDRNYKLIRNTIDAEIRKGVEPERVLDLYQLSTWTGKENAQSIFAWAYAAWQTRKRYTDYKPQFERIWRPREAMQRAKAPRNYQWSRLRFLMEAWGTPFKQFEPLGQRLVRRNPNDYEVKYYFVRVLSAVGTESAKNQAIGYVQSFMRAKPKKISYLLNLGGVYETSWYIGRGRKTVDGQKAIEIYRKYLKSAPKKDPARLGLEKTIAYIQMMEKKWHS